MKLYYPKSHYDAAYRRLLFPLLKPFIKGKNFTNTQRKSMYGVSETDFDFTNVLEEATLVILPMAWNYYIKTKQTEGAIAFVEKCRDLNKKVLVYNAGDFGVYVPYIENLLVLRPSGYKSKFTGNEYVLPPFIADPLKEYFDSERIFQRSYENNPRIGFCGQADTSRLNAVKEVAKIGVRNLKSVLGVSKTEKQELISSSLVRGYVLKKLQQFTNVETNFILRKQYRAGVKENKDTHQTTLEFYKNIHQSDYVLCIRGAGNFSVRFYETLAMGRIPVFINTDCSLPLDKTIPWRTHVVWVEYRERHRVAQKVTEFHQALSETDFIALQRANRNLWKDYLTLGGFFKTFFQHYLTTK